MKVLFLSNVPFIQYLSIYLIEIETVRLFSLIFLIFLVHREASCFTRIGPSFQAQTLEALGATVEKVRPVSITHNDHFVNIARRRATEANEFASRQRKNSQLKGKDTEQTNGYKSDGYCHSSVFSVDCQGGFFADQFENLANFRAHYEGTGPEIWEQTKGKLDAFVAAAGTGGTVAGVSRFFQVHPPFLHFLNAVFLNVQVV